MVPGWDQRGTFMPHYFLQRLGVILIISCSWANLQAQAIDHNFFEKKVRPVLAQHCLSCHGPEKQKSGLRLDSISALLAGGESGPAIVRGKPDESLICQVIEKGEPYAMPPKGKLAKDEILAIRAWVKAGAPWPGKSDSEPSNKTTAGSNKNSPALWSFKPLSHPSPPQVRDISSWCQSPIDQFILTGLEAKGLKPSSPLPRHLLIRRATIDLTGLPPTPEEVREFVQDKSPKAFSKVVDRLLASQAYGEKWGRHWLDLARYADSNGMDENMAHANAFRYRDWVIHAFNTDKPYDRFIMEQLAGDLLPASDPIEKDRNITATGFLVIGPKMLAEDDPRKMEMDIVDEQLDTAGRAFLGMTFGCARCHDHKYDPISQADYYSLAGIFKSTKTMANFKVVAMWNERPVSDEATSAARKRAEKEIQSKRKNLDDHVNQGFDRLKTNIPLQLKAIKAAKKVADSSDSNPSPASRMVHGPIPGSVILEAEQYARGNLVRDFTTYGQGIGVVYNAGKVPNYAEFDFQTATEGIYQVEVRHAAADSRPVRLKFDNSAELDNVASAVTGSWTPESQRWSVAGILSLKKGPHRLRMERNGPVPHIDKFAIIPRPEIKSLPVNPAMAAKDDGLPVDLVKAWMAWLKANPTAPTSTEAEIIRIIASDRGPFTAIKDRVPLLELPDQSIAKSLAETVAKAEKEMPPEAMAMAASEGAITDLKVHLRGNYLTLGANAPRGFPRAIESSETPLIPGNSSGRLELARWMTQPGHPLTSRVMANRVWHWHFGAGLVRSPDNFGSLGLKPANQPLLDWLASEFEKDGWSIKKLHRRIMNSSTYQMGCNHDPESFRIDPDNELFWRVNRRRMEAETIRDSMIFLAGDLDRTPGGSLLTIGNHKYVTSTASEKFDSYHVNRRTVYLPITRSSLYDFLQAFDFADPSSSNGERVNTTVAPQALALLNSRLVDEQTLSWARRLIENPSLDDVGRVNEVFLKAYSRPPSSHEVSRALAFIRNVVPQFPGDTQNRTVQAWREFCRAILSSSEFIHVE